MNPGLYDAAAQYHWMDCTNCTTTEFESECEFDVRNINLEYTPQE